MGDCGSCKHFQKLKSKVSGGLCELKDWLTTTDGGHKCKEYKRVKFHKSVGASMQEVGKDIHVSTAADVFDVAEGDVTKEQRDFAKAVNHVKVYGGSM